MLGIILDARIEWRIRLSVKGSTLTSLSLMKLYQGWWGDSKQVDKYTNKVISHANKI